MRREPALYERFLSEFLEEGILEEGAPLGGVETVGLAVDEVPL
jgi:hypothetical protein